MIPIYLRPPRQSKPADAAPLPSAIVALRAHQVECAQIARRLTTLKKRNNPPSAPT